MNANLLMCIIFFVSVHSAAADKFYKTVDENGNVTYSQIPPRTDGNSNVKIEVVEVEENAARTRMTTEFGKEYCGEIQLLGYSEYKRSSSKRYAEDIVESLEEWERSLAKISEELEWQDRASFKNHRYNSSYQSRQTVSHEKKRAQNTQRMRDLRCAIHWAENKQDEIRKYEIADEQEVARLSEVAQKLEADLDSQCGKQPIFDPTDRENENLRSRWYNCSKEILRDLKKVHQRMGRL